MRGPDEVISAPAQRGERSVTVGGNVSSSSIYTDTVIQTHAPPLKALHQLRAPLGDFIGREQLIETLIKTLRHGSPAHITGINGMGGIGKTELALLVAQRLKDDYPDAQFFINLQGPDAKPRPAEEVLATCIRAFVGPEIKLPQDQQQLSQLYLSQLSGKRVLLLLDNAADRDQVSPLRPPIGSALLVTSRQTIPGVTPLTLNLLTEEEAQELLLAIAPRAEPLARQICALCGYLPLAIRAAGSLLAARDDLDPEVYATQLKDERNRLEHIGREGVDISVEASFNLSYTRLVPEAARVFRVLSVFPGSFDAVAEVAVCVDPGHTQLSDLVRHRLVLYDENTKRYRLHDLARLFAEARLDQEERMLGQKRHADHFLIKAEAIEPHLGETVLRKHMDQFKADQENMRAAFSWSLENNEEMALRFAYSVSGFWNILGQLKEERSALNLAIEKATGGPVKLRMRVLGRAAARQSDLKSAKTLANLHLNLSHETGERVEQAWALQNLGNIARLEGNLTEGRSLLEHALTLFRQDQDQDKAGMMRTLLNLCIVAVDQDDLVSARKFVTESFNLSEELGNRGYLPVTRCYMAFLLHRDGEQARSDELINKSIEMLREDDRQSWLPWGLHWRGRIATDRREFDRATIALTESLTLFQKNEDTYGQTRSLLAFSWLNTRQGFWERAATLLSAEESQRKQQHSPPAPDWRREIESIHANSRSNLGDAQFARAWAAGEQMSLAEVVVYALENGPKTTFQT